MAAMDRFGRRSVFTCPDCGGTLWEVDDGASLRFRCHVGHAYSEAGMNAALEENLARALAASLRALDERIALLRKLEKEARNQGRNELVHSWSTKAAELEREADVIRGSIARVDTTGGEPDSAASGEPHHRRAGKV